MDWADQGACLRVRRRFGLLRLADYLPMIASRAPGECLLRLTRAELHELVWTKPMTELARQFGLRDQHIAKACDGADIARPRAGYWQKVEYGKSVSRSALNNECFGACDIVAIDASGWSIFQP